MRSRIKMGRSRRALGSGFVVGLALRKMVRPTLATILAIVVVASVTFAVVASPRVSAVGPGLNGKIAFASYRDGNYEVYVMNADGTAQTRLTNNTAEDDDPVWSLDGTKIAFTSDRDGNYEVYVMNADGSGQTNLTNNAAWDAFSAWSPDGSKIVFASSRDGNFEIYVMNADGSAQTRLTNNAEWDLDPAWSPDGAKIAFMSVGDGGNYEIYVMNADGSAQTRLTNNTASDGHPAWSPDGSKIAFYSNRDGNDEVYAMNADGSSQSRLTNNSANDRSPAWSPDGTRIAFETNRDGNYEVYAMNADGSKQARLTSNAAYDGFPDWQSVGLVGLASLMFFPGMPRGSILLVVGDLELNPHGSKPSGVGYQQGRDTTPVGFVSGMLTYAQPTKFDTDTAWVGSDGRPLNTTAPTLVFSIGGPGINSVSHYYETTTNASDRAPIMFSMNATHYIWTNRTDDEVLAVLRSSCNVPPGTTDVFVIQILRDADGRLVVLMYGTRYTGTWAAAWTFKYGIYPWISDFRSSYYIFRWTDAASGADADSIPSGGDTYTILALG